MLNLLFLSVFLAMGFFFILADILKLPTVKVSKAVMNAGRNDKKLSGTAESILLDIAVKLSGLVRMDEYKKNRLKDTLKASGIQMTPETYTAYAYVKAGALLLLIPLCLLVFPLLCPVIVFLALAIYYKEIRKASEKLKAKRDQMESELPRFVATIEQELKNSRDVLSILENFKKSASVAFAEELDIVSADMRSSNYEAALTRFEARLNSPQLSDVVRGLIIVLRGDDGAIYFKMLAHDFKLLELQRLKTKAQKIPPKIRIFSFLMLMCFLLTYLLVIILEIIKSLGGMF